MNPTRLLIGVLSGAVAVITVFALAVSGIIPLPRPVSTLSGPSGAGALQVQQAADVVTTHQLKSGSPVATAMVQTQRMSDATLNSSQDGWWAKGQRITLICFKHGQKVRGYFSPWIPGGWDDIWYQASDGKYVADVDIETGSNNTVTGQCGSAPPPAPAPTETGSNVAVDTNQWYRIVNRNSGFVVDVGGAGTKDGTSLQQYKGSANNKAQTFRFVQTDPGWYRILSQLSSTQVWDVSNAGTGNGSKVQTWSWATVKQQQWKLVDAKNGWFAMIPRHANRCLDVPGASKGVVQLQIYDCNQTGAQQWRFETTGLGQVVPGRYQSPFAPGQTATVCQGYNGSPSHTGDIALDISLYAKVGSIGCDPAGSNVTANVQVYAPISGAFAVIPNGLGGTCITADTGGGSIYLGHLIGTGANRHVNAGDPIGLVAPPNGAGNGPYSHIHASARSGPNCDPKTKVPFDQAHNSRWIGSPDIPFNSDKKVTNQGSGVTIKR